MPVTSATPAAVPSATASCANAFEVTCRASRPAAYAADAEVPGVAERGQAGVAEQEIQAGGEEPEDQDLGEQEGAVVVEHRRGDGEEREHREPDREPRPRHLPNSPCGRTIRISAIVPKSANGAACGKPCCWPRATPSDCT